MDYLVDFDMSWDLEDGPERIKLLERVIAGADAHNDISTAIEARDILIEVCSKVGFAKKQLQAFSWLVKIWEEDERNYDTHDLFWKYKWITEDIPTFSEVSETQINELLNDMNNRTIPFALTIKSLPLQQFGWEMKITQKHFLNSGLRRKVIT